MLLADIYLRNRRPESASTSAEGRRLSRSLRMEGRASPPGPREASSRPGRVWIPTVSRGPGPRPRSAPTGRRGRRRYISSAAAMRSRASKRSVSWALVRNTIRLLLEEKAPPDHPAVQLGAQLQSPLPPERPGRSGCRRPAPGSPGSRTPSATGSPGWQSGAGSGSPPGWKAAPLCSSRARSSSAPSGGRSNSFTAVRPLSL